MGESRVPETLGLMTPPSCCEDWKAVTCTCCVQSAVSCNQQNSVMRALLCVIMMLSANVPLIAVWNGNCVRLYNCLKAVRLQRAWQGDIWGCQHLRHICNPHTTKGAPCEVLPG